ncbi:PREDICTED: ladinin-1 isoform X1 [Thamnophis sirtalis]|uniref:Ladinin-1 isoform X1 n=1 Tax=Thamnophis sirtalis TaxID=35019 RepID=A0A6I9XY65_9SAUR|nr:PREDICTED: ladinin-1 isoform X1 [Thamnophis sirtalis]
MSFNRKNWSALSSLAQQWSVEDGEEQERERRRRHRQLSSTSETKAEESSSKVQNATRPTSNRVNNSLEAKLLNLENSALKNEKTEPVAVNKLEGRRVWRRAEFLNNIKQDKKILVSTKKFEKEPPEENPASPPESSKEEGRAEKCETLIQQKDAIEESHHIQSPKKEEITLEQHEALKQEKDLKTDEDQVFSEEEKVPSICESQRLVVTQNEVASQEPQRISCERKSISRLEVKIQPRARKFTDPAVTTPASEAPQATEKSIPKSNAKTIRSPSGQEGFDAPILISEPRITYSSSFNRISPRTISFRVVPKKERQEDALSRSASMRLPASTVKLEEKLERYASAVQRSGSIKVSSPIRRNFQLPLEGVASRRSIFEATIPVQSELPTLVRKESLRMPGGVSSRINLWISRTQESKKNEGDKDIQRTGNTTQGS